MHFSKNIFLYVLNTYLLECNKDVSSTITLKETLKYILVKSTG